MNKTNTLKLLLISVFLLLVMGCPQTTGTKQDAPLIVGEVTLSTNPELPLVAYYTRDSVNTEPVTVRVKGKTEDMDIAHTYEAGYGKEFPIFGLYPNYENKVEVLDGSQKITESVITASLPSSIPVAAVINNFPIIDSEYNAFNRDLYWTNVLLDTFGGERRIIAYDTNGEVRYYVPSEYQVARVFFNNNSLQIVSNNVTSLTGKVLEKGVALHHDRITLNNGNSVFLTYSEYGVEDAITEVTSSGDVVREETFGSLFRDIVNAQTDATIKAADESTLNQIIYDNDNIYGDTNGNGLDDGNASEPDFDEADWAHANSLVYDASDDTMYFSLRHQGVIAVNYREWTLEWWMADEDLHTMSNVPGESGEYGKLNFHDVESLLPYRVNGDGLTDGPKNQHALFLHKNGNLGMFDNNGDENNNPEGSRYVEYKISGSLRDYSAAKVEEYVDTKLHSRIVSDVDFTGEGNLLMYWGYNLIQPSPTVVLREVNLYNNKILFELKLDFFNGYRVDKMPLYPYQDESKAYSLDANAKENY